MTRYIPTDKDLKSKVKLVEVPVKGRYMAAIDERRRVSRNYKIKVLVPEGFTKSDLKRLTPRALAEDPSTPDFVFMRDFYQDGTAKKTTKTMKLADLYSARELSRFDKFRKELDQDIKAERKARGDVTKGVAGDTSDIDPDTGLPPVFNDEPAEEEGGEDE